MAWNIVRHSFVLLFRNFSDALKVSVGPLALSVLAASLLVAASGLSPEVLLAPTENVAVTAVQLLAVVMAAVIMFLGLSWVAVAWHRFILLEEYPGLLPAFRSGPLVSYMGRSLGLAVLMAVILLPIAAIAGGTMAILGLTNSALAGLVLGFAMGLVFTFVWLRVALVLPGVALGASLTIREAWAASSPASNDIFNVAAIIVALNLAAGIVVETVLGSSVLALIVDLGLTWVTMMVGTSLLTTLYGHLIEGRPLP